MDELLKFGEEKKKKKTPRITSPKLSPGVKLLGVITEVNADDLVVSLPGGLRGYVKAEEASDVFYEERRKENVPNHASNRQKKESESTGLVGVFKAGQLVSCVILDIEQDDRKDAKGSKRIMLSLRLSLLQKWLNLDAIQKGMVMSVCIKSVEDHGYILDIGSSSISGFLQCSDPSAMENGELTPQKGKILQSVVSKIDSDRGIVFFDSGSDVVSTSLTQEHRGLSFDLLAPGMLINARVQSLLENGILLSFFTYFTGTVDLFNLDNPFLSSTWQSKYHEHMKVRARITMVDPATRAVALTMNPHLIRNKIPPSLVKAGDIYEGSRVIRVDKNTGLLLEVPSSPTPMPAYVKTSNIADEGEMKLNKKFKEGDTVKVRILDFRLMEGFAIGSLKLSAFEESFFTHADVKPGMVVKGNVIAIGDFGALVQFLGGLKALCPLQHMSELNIVKPPKKFKVGATLVFRVLGCKSKRITVTHKRTLVRSKLCIIASYTDITEGSITHGWITKIEKHGCFVRFYNGVQGFTHLSEITLDPGSDINSSYHVGQVVKCKVITAVPSSRRINLSFYISSKRPSLDDVPTLGSKVSGVVEKVSPSGIVVCVNGKEHLKGTIVAEHLADHCGHANLMKTLLKPGYVFEELLVLEQKGKDISLSAKLSLIESADQLSSDISLVQPHTVIHGYICNMIDAGCFVRYLGNLTGFAPKKNTDVDWKKDVSEMYYIGQSVRSHIKRVDAEAGRMTLSLKQADCFSTDATFIRGYFRLEEEIAKLQLSASGGSDLKWVDSFPIGSIVEGTVQEWKDYGILVGFGGFPGLVGFISKYQLDSSQVEIGSSVRAMVLDLSKVEGIIDLSLRKTLMQVHEQKTPKRPTSEKKRKREIRNDLTLHQIVRAEVEIVKENYLVLSLPDHNNTIGYASSSDFNTIKFPSRRHVEGESITVSVEGLPSSSAGRLLCLLKSLSENGKPATVKRAKRSYAVGSIADVEILDIKPYEMRVKFGVGLHGRIHITEVRDGNDGCAQIHPFDKFRVGEILAAKIVEEPSELKIGRSHVWELSIKPSVLSDDGIKGHSPEEFNFSVGEATTGYIVKIDTEWVRVAVSRHVKGDMFVLDSSAEPAELKEFEKRFTLGQALSCCILSVNKEKKSLRLGFRDMGDERRSNSAKVNMQEDFGSANSVLRETGFIREGDIIGGKISKVLPGVGGLLVQIGPHLYGKVHFTELADSWETNPLSNYSEGLFVKCRVLDIKRSERTTLHVDLSLRASMPHRQSLEAGPISFARFENIDDLHPKMEVKGYVKNITGKGCFIMLSRHIDARILMSNLSDGFVENPESEFPVGKLVTGRVLSVEPLSKRVDVTLKSDIGINGSTVSTIGMPNFKVGDVISGRIRRVETYGLFVKIDHSNTVGLCHRTELSDDHIENIEAKYRAGDEVSAKVLKIDEERNRVSLGMKSSYLVTHHVANGSINNGTFMHDTDDEDLSDDLDIVMNDDLNGSIDEAAAKDAQASSIDEAASKDAQASDQTILLHQMERASVPPLEIDFDDEELEQVEENSNICVNEKKLATDRATNDRRLKKKAKEERELQIQAAERKLLEKNAVPTTPDDFEKLVRSSPNSSYMWIKYMAFMLSLRDIPKARSVAERALTTINMREEGEKLNVWVAYMNLENEHGSPREEAVQAIFQRALQSCDSKRIYFALLGLYERTEQQELALALLDKMVKKFRTSCKVWLSRVQNLLKHGEVAQAVINRALQTLPQRKHIKFITQVAILEFKLGSPDRGRVMFESMLKDYPKRTDIWSVYLDQEIRLKDPQLTRSLFEKAISLSLPPKKMKFLFKKYLDYEKSNGDDDRVEYVKQRAMEYVENSIGS